MSMKWIVFVPLTLTACGAEVSTGESAAVQGTAAEARSSDPAEIVGTTWYWLSTVTPVERIEVNEPERYTLLLHDGGDAELQADCNQGRGPYQIGQGTLTAGPFISTRRACPEDSIDHLFLRQLENAAVFFVEGGYLFIDQKMDSGTMRFGASPGADVP